MPLLCQHDQWSGHYCCLHARGHCQDPVSLQAWAWRNLGGPPLCLSCPYLLSFRIQNMRMIDGKPEYKNGLVRKQGWGLGLEDWMSWENNEGSGVGGPGPQRSGPSPMSCPPACLGCAGEGRSLRRLLQLVEGLYTVLCPLGPPHRPHLHLLGADEQGLQASFPQWLRQARGL